VNKRRYFVLGLLAPRPLRDRGLLRSVSFVPELSLYRLVHQAGQLGEPTMSAPVLCALLAS
jgi:hypothetical protein